MAANPKYADLPGIAYDQRDVYETSDLPEVDQGGAAEAPQEENDAVERMSLASIDAYATFRDKALDAAHADFSDRIRPRRHRGYDAGDYEMAADGAAREAETPQQRYQRLRHELSQFVEDLEARKQKGDGGEGGGGASALARQTEALRLQLNNAKLEELLGAEVVGDPHAHLQRKLLAEVESFKRKTTTEAATVAPSSIVYELHFRPEVAKFNRSAKLADIDERLRKLECVLGPDVDKAVSLAGDANHGTVLEALSLLHSKLNLLEPAHLDQVDAHLAALSLRLAQLAEKRALVEDAERLSKVSELHELLRNNEELCAELPVIVERLLVLREIHEQTLQFSAALSQLDATQQQIASALKHNQEALGAVRAEFSRNADVIRGNVASLDARIKAVAK